MNNTYFDYKAPNAASELSENVSAAIKQMISDNTTSTYYWLLNKDVDNNNWAIVLGWADGFNDPEPNEDASYQSESYHICIKLAYQPDNSIMQCDYDVDWTMPYDKTTSEVDDTDTALYPGDDIVPIVESLLSAFARYADRFASKTE